MAEKISKGKINKFISDNTLLNQIWIMDPKKKVSDILKENKVPIYVSAISCEIRGVTDQDLKDTNSRKVLPKTLLNLSLEADRTFVY